MEETKGRGQIMGEKREEIPTLGWKHNAFIIEPHLFRVFFLYRNFEFFFTHHGCNFWKTFLYGRSKLGCPQNAQKNLGPI